MDADYIARCGDTAYAVGQRLVIRNTEVSESADLVERLGKALMGRAAS